MRPLINTYSLGENSKVTVYKIFGKQYYFAIVESDGRYPQDGYIARNVGRDEFLLVLSGEIEVNKNGKSKTLNEGGFILLGQGTGYVITGKGKVLVFVNDGKNGDGKSRIDFIK